MTEYALPRKVEPEDGQESEQKPLFVEPTVDHENASRRTWQQLEQTNGLDTEPEHFDEDSVAGHLKKITLAEGGRGPRDSFIVRYRWVPYSKQEAGIAVDSLSNRASTAVRAKQGSGQRAAESLFDSVDRFRAEAVESIASLREAVPSIDEGDMKPSIEGIRQTPVVREELSKFMLGLEQLVGYKWHPRRSANGPNQKREVRLAELDGMIDSATDEDLVTLWQKAAICNQTRLRFWASEADKIKGDGSLPELTDEDIALGAKEARRVLGELGDEQNPNKPAENPAE